MAAIILGVVGAKLGGAALGTAGAMIGQAVGAYAGYHADQAIFGERSKPTQSASGKLTEMLVQSSAYGRTIPVVFGSAKLAGNIIWADKVREHAEHHTQSIRMGKGKKKSHTHTSYRYTISMAIAIGEGPIDEVEGIWVDEKPIRLDHPGLRIHKGGEDQQPDPLIEAALGAGNVPAYRGLAYVVFENFELGEVGNHIPHVTFKIRRQVKEKQQLEEQIRSMVIIPGSGEFVYDTEVQHQQQGLVYEKSWFPKGGRFPINHHTHEKKSNAMLAMEQLKETCPNVEWVAPVVTWFGSDLDMKRCKILPRVEHHGDARTFPDAWQVAGKGRGDVPCVSYDDGRPRYGGTVSDRSILRFLDECRVRGYKILFYPMIFMDLPQKPWRGWLTGRAEDVKDFFDGPEGYRAFILHYAHLVKGKVDGFVIGSEYKGITAIHDADHHFPAVDHFIQLARDVKQILGDGVKITYAADWSEYHHTDGGWYHLDPLWACDAIDVVGIDAYFPLTDLPQHKIQPIDIEKGWHSGEGYDWYRGGEDGQTREPLSPPYAWKNIGWWWENPHINPDGKQTAWQPKSKKIWFTEYGFASMDGCSNQPNIFYDQACRDGGIPRHSYGYCDIGAQRMALEATERAWKDSPFLERKFLWTWDARPYPYWPDLKHIWADGPLWSKGHWVSGKLGVSGLGAVVAMLCRSAKLSMQDIDVSRLQGVVEGLVVTEPQTVRDLLELLQLSYGFTISEQEGRLVMRPHPTEPSLSLSCDDCLVPEGVSEHRGWEVIMDDASCVPSCVEVHYICRDGDVQPGVVRASVAGSTHTGSTQQIQLPLVLDQTRAQMIAERLLHMQLVARTRYRIFLPPFASMLYSGDVVRILRGKQAHDIAITHQSIGMNGMVQIEGVKRDLSRVSHAGARSYIEQRVAHQLPSEKAECEVFEIKALPWKETGNAALICAFVKGSDAYQGGYLLEEGGALASPIVIDLPEAAVYGALLDPLPASRAVCAWEGEVDVVLSHGALGSSVDGSWSAAPYALIGDEIIQFREAKLVESHRYRLSGIMRGCLGTDQKACDHPTGTRFLLLDPYSIGVAEVPLAKVGQTLTMVFHQEDEMDPLQITTRGEHLKPLSPAHVRYQKKNNRDLEIRWIRRSRQSAGWRDYVDIPLGEEVERYELQIVCQMKIVRDVKDLSLALFTYTKNMQLKDGVLGRAFEIHLWQCSSLIGRGDKVILAVNNKEKK